MHNKILTAGALLGALMIPVAAHAQSGVATGAAAGAVGGAVVGGPVGAVVGGIGGAAVGGISESTRPRFRTYVVEQRVPSYTYNSQVVVGAELPDTGVTYYEVPAEYGVPQYRYTVVNDRTVLVDPRTRRVVQVIE
jgi:hypothetical protein